jgi:hypothetical protein
MSKFNWRRTALRDRPTLSFKDEADAMERDAAGRWLERYTRWHPEKKKFRRRGTNARPKRASNV